MVGTNFVSDAFMEGVAQCPTIQVVAVCSRNFENAKRFASKYAIPLALADYQDLVEERLDGVYLAVPNALHYELARYFIEHGIAVFLEKPFCVNEQQAAKLLALAAKKQVLVHDGLMPLYLPGFSLLRNALVEIGPLRKVVLNFSKVSSRYEAYLRGENPTTFRKELANGALMDLGIYALGLAVALFGEPQSLIAHSTLLESGVDGASTVLLQYAGFEVVILVSKINDTQMVSEFCGEQGVITVEQISTLRNITLHKPALDKQVLYENTITPFVYQLQAFEKAYIGSAEPLVCAALTYSILKTLTHARQQAGVWYAQDE
ncbi:MAG: Gfo/Idh/MocA family protein [Erysipelotrichaceae bacterium]